MLLLLLVRWRAQQRGAAGPDRSGAGVGAAVRAAVGTAVGTAVSAAVAVGTTVAVGAEPPRGGARLSRACAAAAAAAMEVQVAPLRAWDDFFPGSDRFALPDLKDISKWNNRVVSNLLYYQTNYLMVAAALVSIVGSVRGLAGQGRAGGVRWPRSPGGGSAARCHGKGPGRPREGCDSIRGGESCFSPSSFLLFPFFSPYLLPLSFPPPRPSLNLWCRLNR